MRRTAIGILTLALGVGLLAACTSVIPIAPPLSDSSSPSTGEDDTVYAFFLIGGADPYDRSAYVGAERPVRHDAGIEDRLTAAMEELVKGPTRRERKEGLSSMVSRETAGLVRKVVVRDGNARVVFRDFRELIPQVSTSTGGLAFKFSLNLTVFQFDEIEQVQYSIDGNCHRFWAFLQAGECRPPITRSDWNRSWESRD